MQQTVYICIGIPGSGKSTHSKIVEFTSCFAAEEPADQIIRINQDAFHGDRAACNRHAEWSLKRGHSIIVDRCNVSKSQRKYWIDLAKQHNCRLVGELFRVDPQTCLQRVHGRKDHETMTDPKKFKAIVYGFRTTWQEPSLEEGFDEINVRNESGKVVGKIPQVKPTLWQIIKVWFK